MLQLLLSGSALIGASLWSFVWYWYDDPMFGAFAAGMLTIAALHFNQYLQEKRDAK
jgi:hypothetical protein